MTVDPPYSSSSDEISAPAASVHFAFMFPAYTLGNSTRGLSPDIPTECNIHDVLNNDEHWLADVCPSTSTSISAQRPTRLVKRRYSEYTNPDHDSGLPDSESVSDDTYTPTADSSRDQQATDPLTERLKKDKRNSDQSVERWRKKCDVLKMEKAVLQKEKLA